ncbi:Cl- channel voltage-gated family protein [Erwinia sp. OLTSP20]|uniref:chloride channel protein n=1 Tax=unclassified Erwinia TaxID=2622719 RepID=UPI000C17E37B|nr:MULTISPECIES: chloride channel protein [unclassified Erwinia]PIJ50229.1 Cl- channel voltage-gated family protein [Erwinia sp. OAMSP11]PIJ72066.1 Cl- channel voltage-gated family protein [Erwinia sp. OLSSP12]PIJ81357.1 Cl- channel voltage-gated family protein [Erwinia sp. OLCASP19]PIJ84063.1 Cl- channel voltage-gated family protein [Erwinia sp. OLMTSP26]PIJ85762.1 Cl- channel voltage-gated family protein [Erwinia sp. OLMDSP33]
MSINNRHILNWTSILVAIPIGMLGAMATLLFRVLIELLTRLIFGSAHDITRAVTAWPWFCWPLIVGFGGILAGIFLHYASRMEQQQHVRTDYLEVINARLEAVPTRTSLYRALSSLFSISSGASIGKEGPMVQLAALAGSLAARFIQRPLKLQNSDVVAMAAAAGLASVYHAPLASAIFVAEIAYGISALQRLIPLVVSAGVAVLTMWMLGNTSALYPLSAVQFTISFSSILLTLVVGLVSGLTGWLIIRLIALSKRQFARVKNLPLRLGLGGLAVGVLAIGSTDILGNGYEVIVRIMSGELILQMLLVLFALKLVATALSVGSGAVGGLFTPSLLLGALTGSIVALFANLAGMPVNNSLAFAAIGMGAVLAAVSQAPLMAMLMVLEMTFNSSLLFPSMIACCLAAMTVYRLQSASTYPLVTEHLSRADAWFDFDNSIIAQYIVSGAALHPQDSVGKALAVSSIKRDRFVYVIDQQGAFLGAVSVHDISHQVLDKTLTLDSPVSEVMDSGFPVIYQFQTIRQGWDTFSQISLERLPVLNNASERKYLGVISKTSLIQKAKTFI